MVSIVSLGRFTPGDYKERRRGQSDAAHNLAAGKRRQGCSTVLQLIAKDSLLQTIDKNSEKKFDRRGLMFSRALQERAKFRLSKAHARMQGIRAARAPPE
jgi:hypothetical protein